MAKNENTKIKKTTKVVDESVPAGQMEIPYETPELTVVETKSEGKCCNGECNCSKMKESYVKLAKHIINGSKLVNGALIGGIQINTLPRTGEYIVNSKTVLDYDGLVEYLVESWMSL